MEDEMHTDENMEVPPVEELDTLETAEENKNEVAEWQEKYIRLAADMENLRKRSAKEIVDSRNFAVKSFALEMLSVADNLERAVAETSKTKTTETKAILDGISMVQNGLTNSFGKFQIQKFESLNQLADPEKHQVMTQLESTEPERTVIQEMQAGYTIAERLLRPALVAVSKGDK